MEIIDKLSVRLALQSSSFVGTNNIIKIVCGNAHISMLSDTGQVHTIGDNNRHQCEIPNHIRSAHIIDIESGGDHTISLDSTGQVYCWGSNRDGQTRQTNQCIVPLEINEKRVSSITGGNYYSACSFDDGSAIVWGDNDDGQCEVPGDLNNIKSIHGGGETNVYCLTHDNTLHVWGNKKSNMDELLPYQYTRNIKSFHGGQYHHLAVTTSGKIVGWGSPKSCELEIPDDITDPLMISVNGELPGWSLVLTKDNKLHAFGDNSYGQCAYDLPYSNNVKCTQLNRNYKYISTGLTWSVGIDVSGEVRGWGILNADCDT